VPVSRLDRTTLQALTFARSIVSDPSDVTAVHVTDDPVEGKAFQERWDHGIPDTPLMVIESPYRALLPPLLAYIDERGSRESARPVTVVLAEFVPRHFWEYFLHNQTALRLKLQLFFRPNTIVVDVPFHLSEADSTGDGQASVPARVGGPTGVGRSHRVSERSSPAGANRR
jgi:hypothetical protein